MDNENQPQDAQEVDPIQAMIQQALASSGRRPQTAPSEATPPVGPNTEMAEDRPSLGQRIGAKSPSPMTKPAQSAPVAPSPDTVIPPGATGVLRPVTDSLTNKSVPSPPASNWSDLLSQQASLGKTIDPKAVDQTGKQKYRMGWGARLAGILGNAAGGFATEGRGPATYVGPGATNRQYAVDESTRKADLGSVNEQIGTREKLDESNRKLYEANTQGQQREVQGQVAQMKAETGNQLADIRQQLADVANNKEKDTADAQRGKLDQLAKDLEERARRNDQMFIMGQGNLDAKRQIAEVAAQLKQAQLEASQAKFTTGTDAKSLESERKQRITSVENDWKQHPYLNKIFGSSKESQIKAINDEIDGRLKGAGVDTGKPAPSAGNGGSPAPTTHAWSKSAWAKANPSKDANAAAAAAQKQGFQVAP